MRDHSTVSNLALFCIVTTCPLSGRLLRADDGPDSPRIESVVTSVRQPQASAEAVIRYDDFDGSEKAYTESQGPLDDAQAFGGQGRSMLSLYNSPMP